MWLKVGTLALMNPDLSILIATMGCRNEQFLKLMKLLLSQVNDFHNIEVIAYWNNGEKSIGEIRQALLNQSKGEYVCFIDDDDAIPPYYCVEILSNLGKDYVGFEVELYNDGVLQPRVMHSILYKNWSQDAQGFYRGVTHLNPIKRSIAIQGKFFGEAGEDERWSRSVTPFVLTENYINKIMYSYRHSSDKSNFGGQEQKGEYTRPVINNKYFKWHPLSEETNAYNK
jgi:glycosyltransferase involved in cell wall biosynthesis